VYVYDRRTRVGVHPQPDEPTTKAAFDMNLAEGGLSQPEPATKEAAALDMDLARTFVDAWSNLLIGKMAPKFLAPQALGDALRDQWFDAVAAETRSLQWRSSKWLKPAEWAAQMKAICPEYNNFHAGKVGAWLSKFSGVEVQPAREYSVCIYLKGDPDELSQIETQAKRFRADEVNMQDDGTLRLWWD
jgi:hypothetical protein